MKHWMVLVGIGLALTGCTKVGSEEWCNQMKQKSKGDWTANQAADFAKHCIF